VPLLTKCAALYQVFYIFASCQTLPSVPNLTKYPHNFMIERKQSKQKAAKQDSILPEA